MKKLFPLGFIALIFAGTTGYAQQTSGGIRSGVSYWMDQHGKSCFSKNGIKGQSMTWDNQVFYRYQGTGRWAFETSIGHYAFNNSGGFKDAPASTSPDYLNTGIHEKSQNIEWTVSAQYDISCPAMQSCPMMKKLKSYAGLSLSPTWSRSTTEFTYQKISDASRHATNSTVNEINLWVGLSHTLVYDLCDHLNIMSVVSFDMQPDRLFEKHSGVSSVPDSRMSWQLGVGYKFH